MPAPRRVFVHGHQAGMKLSMGQPRQQPRMDRADRQRLADRKNNDHLAEPRMDGAAAAASIDALRNDQIGQSAQLRLQRQTEAQFIRQGAYKRIQGLAEIDGRRRQHRHAPYGHAGRTRPVDQMGRCSGIFAIDDQKVGALAVAAIIGPESIGFEEGRKAIMLLKRVRTFDHVFF